MENKKELMMNLINLDAKDEGFVMNVDEKTGGLRITLGEKYKEVFNILRSKMTYLEIKEQYLRFMKDLQNENLKKEGRFIRFFRNANIIVQFCKESYDDRLFCLAEVVEEALSRSTMAPNPDMNSYGFIESLKILFSWKIGREGKAFDNIKDSIERIIKHVDDMLQLVELFEKKTGLPVPEVKEKNWASSTRSKRKHININKRVS